MKNAILIVDDSRLNRETLADILKDKYNIIEAEDGRSGLEVLEKRKDDIVLVILDIDVYKRQEAVSLALEFIKSMPCGEAEYCWLSYEPDNAVARQMYRLSLIHI